MSIDDEPASKAPHLPSSGARRTRQFLEISGGELASSFRVDADGENARSRVVFVNRSYWPDQEATGQLLTELCESLSDQFDVHVICGQPNRKASAAEFQTHGRETRNGVTIHRLPHSTLPKRWPAGRLLNLLSFTRSVQKYLARVRLDADLFVSETDPFLLPPVIARHASSVGARFVAYLQDIYPDVAIAVGVARDNWITRRLRRMLFRAYERADRVVVLGEDMQQRLVDWGIDETKIGIVPNWVDCQSVVPVKRHNPFRQTHSLEDRFVVMHSGNMGLTQHLQSVVAATQSEAWPEDALLLLVGEGAMRSSLERQVAETGNQRVKFLPYQPRDELSESLSAADLHLVSSDERTAGCLFPSKLYGILASASPVLMIADEESEPARLVRRARVGWTCLPRNPERIAQAVAEARGEAGLPEIGARARRLAESQFDRSVCCGAFREILQELVPVSQAVDQASDETSLVGSSTMDDASL